MDGTMGKFHTIYAAKTKKKYKRAVANIHIKYLLKTEN